MRYFLTGATGFIGGEVAQTIGRRPVTKWLHWFAILQGQRMLQR